ncbi:MAG: hypothetical protein PHR44_08130 [Candidatus Omnitrophica bacterium]|nr:hypothetical protein [Candidatus Omnitrophota bacterium]
MFIKENKGQSTLEFAILIVVIIGALIAMQTFIKRGYQGRLRSASDDMGEQYSPGYTQSDEYNISFAHNEERVKADANNKIISISEIKNQHQDRINKESVAKSNFEFWGEVPEEINEGRKHTITGGETPDALEGVSAADQAAVHSGRYSTEFNTNLATAETSPIPQ